MTKKTDKEPPLQQLGSVAMKTKKPGTPTKVIAANEAEEAEQDMLRHKLWHKAVLVSVATLSVLAITAAGLFSFAHGSFSDIYLGSMQIKADVSQAELEKQIEQAAKQYKLTLQYLDGSKKLYPLSTVGITIDAKASAEAAKKSISTSLPQRLAWWEPINLNLVTKTNKTFQKFISAKATQTKTAPKNATLVTAGGKVKIVNEKQGKGNIVVNAEVVIPRAVASLQSSPLIVEQAILRPKIMTSDLESSKSKIKSILNQKVIFNIAGQAVTARPSDIANWIELAPIEEAKTVDVTVNSGKISEYINTIATPYIQPPRSRLIMKTAGESTVLDPGTSGIDVINKDQSAKSVAKRLLDNKGLTVDLSVKYATAQTVEVKPYDKWIVVDTTNKRMYAYEKTKLVRTFLVSAGAPLTPTVLGKYTIYSKNTSQDMTGANADGSRYFQPDVPYVNYFYADYAIHGNYWRPSSYFGNINSSHGCVGITVSDSIWIYNWAPVGTTVFVHA